MNAEIDAGTPKLCGFRPARAISRPIHYLEIYNLWHSNAISARIHYFEIDMFDEKIQTTWFWGAFTMWKSTISTQKSQPILVNRLDIGNWTQSKFGNRPFSTKNMILRLIQPSEIDEKQYERQRFARAQRQGLLGLEDPTLQWLQNDARARALQEYRPEKRMRSFLVLLNENAFVCTAKPRRKNLWIQKMKSFAKDR